MARKDALLRLHQLLVNRRDELRKRLGMELSELGHSKEGYSSGDSADAAFEAGSEEMSSALAEIEARELWQIEHALGKLRQGTYGICDICGGKIPVIRLNALPYVTSCIRCAREAERHTTRGNRLSGIDWAKVADPGAPEDRQIKLSDFEVDLQT